MTHRITDSLHRPKIWITKKYDVSENGSVFVFGGGKGLSRPGVSLPSPEDGNTSSFQNVVFQLFIIPGDGQST
jgi:hypothetical protein